MTEQFLDRAQVGAGREKMRRVRMAEAVRVQAWIAVEARRVKADDAANAEKYRLLTRREYQRIVHQYPGSEQASAARQLLRRFDEETNRR